MPLYEYQCETCDHAFERLVLSKRDESPDCPECGAKKTKRLMSCASIMSSSGGGSCGPRASSGFS